LARIFFASTNSAQATDETLVIFKERETWVLTGNAYTGTTTDPGSGWVLKFVDDVGCPSQSLIASLNGFLSWIDYRGVYLWNGTGKPIYTSRPIESMFQDDGDLDKSRLIYGRAAYFRKYNEVVWVLSSRSKGNNLFMLRLDLRLTLPNISSAVDSPMIEGVFVMDYISSGVTGGIYGLYAGVLPGLNDEYLLAGDNTGYSYLLYNTYADVAAGPQFSYKTRYLDFGTPGVTKRFHKVIVYLNDLGAYNLTLNYWTNYRSASSNKSTRMVPISSTTSTTDTAIWDVGVWDVALWDSFIPTSKSITFNLGAEGNNSEGTCLQLQFQQLSANSPVTIYGYSVIYSVLGIRA
jgi:hypothetical protein